ncbi:MAG: sigma-70 family RNA polymerase sigma factor [Nocardioides sp.]|nr:sigma-70 family RNA polymerase sigma factor [Nocardioides sp.]
MTAFVPSSTPTAAAWGRDAGAHRDPVRTDRARRTAVLLDRAAHTADPKQHRNLQDEAVTLNLGVARSIAGRYYGRGISADDLDQVASLALVKAVRRFDPAASRDLLTYAVPTITGELKRHFRDHGWAVRPPRRVTDLLPTVNRAVEDLRDVHEREPRPSEIAFATGLSIADVVEVLTSDGLFTLDSLDAPTGVGEMGGSPYELVGGPDPMFALCESMVDLERALHVLDARERLVVRLRYHDELSQGEIGRRLGVSQMQVSRILTKMLAKLRAVMAERDETHSSTHVWDRRRLVPAS